MIKTLVLKEIVWEDKNGVGLVPRIEDTEPLQDGFNDIPKNTKMTMILVINEPSEVHS